MKGDKKIIDILNSLLAGELTAVDQYLIHGEMYADMGLGQLAEKPCTNPTMSACTPAP
jgi:bacterioferritin